jgi:hypothetical protein
VVLPIAKRYPFVAFFDLDFHDRVDQLDQILDRLTRVEKRLDSLNVPPRLDRAKSGRFIRATAPTAKMAVATEDNLRKAPKPKPTGKTFKGCPPAGLGKDSQNNILKNRVDTSEKWLAVPYDLIHDLEWPEEIARFRYNWSEEDAAVIAQYEGARL